MSEDRCCSPPRGRETPPPPAPATLERRGRPATETMVSLAGGAFTIGSDDALAYPDDGEDVREVELAPFRIDAYALSNDRFAEFVDASGYRTEAERFGWSFVFGGLLPDDFAPTRGVAAAPWWRQVEGADWRHPEGPQSDLGGRGDHPVVHLSWNDAGAYCAWGGVRVPTEAEWEVAARGGSERHAFPWGNELEPGGEHRMNVWQGEFPQHNTCGDGFYGTCPVATFPPNALGLYETTGNVWEWVADAFDSAARVQKGGSYLCHASYCRRYRVAARQGNTPDSSAGNVGFRCAADA